jgi:hypothetical protein
MSWLDFLWATNSNILRRNCKKKLKIMIEKDVIVNTVNINILVMKSNGTQTITSVVSLQIKII